MHQIILPNIMLVICDYEINYIIIQKYTSALVVLVELWHVRSWGFLKVRLHNILFPGNFPVISRTAITQDRRLGGFVPTER